MSDRFGEAVIYWTARKNRWRRERLEELRRRADLVAIGLEDAVDALTAVFELHIPVSDMSDLVCSDCNEWDGAVAYYPCTTIRTMASQLGIEVAE